MKDLDPIDELFERLMAAAASSLTVAQAEDVRHFYDVNESELALETLVSAYVEKHAIPGEGVVQLISDFANELSIESPHVRDFLSKEKP